VPVGVTVWLDCANVAESAQMIAFEVAVVFMFALIGIVTIAAVSRPLAEAYAEKLKTRYKAIGSVP
jgi:hypothetical protein